MNTLVLINPHAAGGRARKLMPRIQNWREANSNLLQNFELAMPESVEAGLDKLSQWGPGTRVVIVGGDGTLNQMLPGLVHRSFEIGLVPFGSGNDCARAWGLHRLTWQEALHFAVTGQAQAIDIGKIESTNGEVHFFHSSLAVGFDASVGQRALAGPKLLTGLARYLLATLREIAHLQNWNMSISIKDKVVHQGTTLLASTLNTPSYGGGMPAVPHATLHDGQLNLLIAGRFNRLQTLWMLPRLLIGKHLGHSRIQTLAFATATISSPQALPLAADGETLSPSTHFQIQVIPAALQVVRAK